MLETSPSEIIRAMAAYKKLYGDKMDTELFEQVILEFRKEDKNKKRKKKWKK